MNGKSFAYVIGLICGILTVVIVALIIRKIANKKMKAAGPKEYDERQMAARGKSYKTGMLTFVIASLLMTLLEVLEVHFAEYPLMYLLILLTGCFAFVIDAIFRDAYFRVGESTKMWWIIPVAALNIFLSFVRKTPLINEDGLLTLDSLNLIVGIWILLIGLIILIKKFLDKKDSKADEE